MSYSAEHSKVTTAAFRLTTVCVGAIVIALLLARFVGLDKDLPSFGISLYQANDEGSYSTLAIKFHNYGSFTNAGTGVEELTTSATFRANILGNAAQMLTLGVFGDNYYGLRMPYAIAGMATLALTMAAFRCCVTRYKMGKVGKWLSLAALLYMVCDFSILMMGRCVENSVLRALVTAAFMWIWFANEKHPLIRYFWLGLLGTASIFLVYFSNVHLLLLAAVMGAWELFRYIMKRDSGFPRYLAAWLGGFALGFVVSEAYYRIVWKSGCVENLLSSVGAFSNRLTTLTGGVGDDGLVMSWIKGFVTFWDSNLFFFGVVVGVVAFLSLGYLFVRALRTSDGNLVMVVGIVAVFILQCVLTNDWAERKSVSVMPAIAVATLLGLFFLYDREEREVVSARAMRWLAILTVLFAFGLVYSTARFRWNKGYFIDFDGTDTRVWAIATAIQLLACLVALGLLFHDTLSNNSRAVGSRVFRNCLTASVVLAFAAAIALNLFYSVKYVYLFDSYTERDARVAIGNIADGQYVGGPFSYGYSLYNDIMPVWNSNDYENGLVSSPSISYFCDYESGTYIARVNGDGEFYLIQSFPRASKAMGIDYPIAIYQRKDRLTN